MLKEEQDSTRHPENQQHQEQQQHSTGSSNHPDRSSARGAGAGAGALGSDAPSLPSFTSTEDENDDSTAPPNDDGDGSLMMELGFLFEGARATIKKRYTWPFSSDRSKEILVALNCIDEEPGAVQSGHYLWPAAHLLVDYLVQREQQVETEENQATRCSNNTVVSSIIELGAGCALASLAALQIYQESLQVVICTDHDPGTCERARDNYESTLEEILDKSASDEEFNATINNLASIPVLFEPLEWGGKEDQAAVSSQLMKHTVNESTHADLVLGTDLIYCVEVIQPLLTTAAELMKETTGRFLLSQSFAYDDEAELAIDKACQQLGLKRMILWQDGKDCRVQEFRRTTVNAV